MDLPRRHLVRWLRLRFRGRHRRLLGLRRGKAGATILHLQRGHCLGIAAVQILIVDDPTVIQRGLAEIDDEDRHRLYEIGLYGLLAVESLLDLLRSPLAVVVAEKFGRQVDDMLGTNATVA